MYSQNSREKLMQQIRFMDGHIEGKKHIAGRNEIDRLKTELLSFKCINII